MRTRHLSLRATAFVALLFATGLMLGWRGAVHATSLAQDTFEITVVGQIDVAGGDDASCPVCNLSLDTADINFGDSTPLTEFEVVVRDGSGAEVDRATSSAAGNALQTISFTVPEISEGESYTLELTTAPSGWLGCFNDPATKTLSFSDFDLGRARADYYFYVDSECPGGPGGGATATPTSGPATPTPSTGDTVSLLVVGFVDVAGGDDPDCPACNGELDDADDDFAASNPLPPLTFVVRNGSGSEVARGTTSALANLQQVAFEVPELMGGQSYTIELDGTPTEWLLCFNDSPRKVVAAEDFQLGSARVDFFFYQQSFCPGVEGPAVPTSEPPDGDDDDDGDDDGDDGDDGDGTAPGGTAPGAGAAPPAPAAPRAPGAPSAPSSIPSPPNAGGIGHISGPGGGTGLGQIKGMGFVDSNGDGVFQAGEPGLNDLRVILRGGGLDLDHITDGTGTFNFGTLGAGVYDVFIEPGSEWFITTPRLYKVTVEGDIVRGVNFGLIRHEDRAALAKRHQPAKRAAHRPHHGVRLPSTGIADLPTAPMLAMLAALLGGLAMVGLAVERRRG